MKNKFIEVTDKSEAERVLNSDDNPDYVWTPVNIDCDICGKNGGVYSIEYNDTNYGYCASCGDLSKEVYQGT